jgi:SAM-dependent methyltransferase
VVPVEPDGGMRERLDAASPELSALDGSAEVIPLPDASVDAVLAGQAYHWFDKDPAHAEIARVLRPGGTFAPVWNVRDESVPWVAALSAAAELRHDGSAHMAELVTDFGPRFSPPENATFTHVITFSPHDLSALVRSRSQYLTSTPERRAEIDAAVQDLIVNHPDLAGREQVELPYVTHVYRARVQLNA